METKTIVVPMYKHEYEKLVEIARQHKRAVSREAQQLLEEAIEKMAEEA